MRKLSSDAIKALKELSRTERSSYVLEDRWVNYPAGSKVLNELQYTLERPQCNRPLGMAVIGDSNNGKTEILKRFIQINQTKRFDDRANVRILDIEAPPTPHLGHLYSKMLGRIGDPRAESGTVGLRLERMLILLRRLEVESLVLDEIHNVLAGSHVQQRGFMNMLKHISNELKAPVIISGTEEVSNVIGTDFQILSRYPIFRLPQWVPDNNMAEFLYRLEGSLPLREESNIWKMTTEIYKLSGGVVGNFVSIIKRAAFDSIKSGEEKITLEALQHCARMLVKPPKNAKKNEKSGTGSS